MIDKFSKKLILASQSPRRRELIEGLGIPFQVRTIPVDEDYPDSLPSGKVAAYLAEKKARAYQATLGNDEWVLTADTIVIVEGNLLNKPRDREEALEMLRRLSGKMHLVITGVCLANQAQLFTESDTTKVFFRVLAEEEITHYVDTCLPFDKAGAYGIQEWIGYVGVEKIEGSFYTVMGLPLHLVYELLKKHLTTSKRNG
jgi:septum formation protein